MSDHVNKDQLIRFTCKDEPFRVIAAQTTTLCETARRLHDTDPTATVALARITTGTALLGGLLKGSQRLALAIEGNGPLQKLHAETDAAGHVRCTIKNRLANLPPRDGVFDVATAIGKAGFLTVVKDLGLKEPYQGMVQLQTSEIGDDIAYYLTTSEQVPSLVSLAVALDNHAAVKTAGGYLIQALPGCSDEAIDRIESRVADQPSLSSLLGEGKSLTTILADIFSGHELTPPESLPLRFRCRCRRDQVAKMLAGLEKSELEAAVTEGVVEVTCEYCRQSYRFTPDEISGITHP
ncbi:MAG: Hsp33 family molecular chaperone HslO [Desulfuromonas sp.]|nr:MAG: Hsp33 family molecular chaperone HslO [Desulfuromonas sp.]